MNKLEIQSPYYAKYFIPLAGGSGWMQVSVCVVNVWFLWGSFHGGGIFGVEDLELHIIEHLILRAD